MRKIYLAIVFVIPGGAIAQQDSTELKMLDEIVVTGQYKPQSLKRSVYQVRVIGREKIEKLGATKLQDVLNHELNIRFSQDLATGGSDITMMGLKGQNVKILVDGLPMVGRQGTSNEININQIDINAVERIEIVEGPMSVIYGADALGGVINIITKKEGKAGLSLHIRATEETIGKEYGFKKGIHNQHSSIRWKKNMWEIGAGAGRNYFGGWKDSASDRELTWHQKDQLVANAFAGFNNGKLNARYRLEGLDEIITNPGNFLFRQQDSGDTLAYDQEYLTNRLAHQLQAGYFVNSDLTFQLQAAYTNYSRQVFSTTVSKNTGDTRLNLAEGMQSLASFTGLTLRGGMFYKVSPLISFQPGFEINRENGKGERLKEGSNQVNDYAFFISTEITPSEKINLRPGVRIIKNSVYDAPPFIPSLNTKFAITENLDLRVSYARGFRSPSIRELYFNFFDANHQIVGNPDLKAETSHSINGSLAWRKTTSSKKVYFLTLGGFYNNVKNLIDYAVSASNPNIFILANVSKSKTAGANLTGSFKHNRWNLAAGAAITGLYNHFSELQSTLPQLQWSGEINSAVGYSFKSAALDLNLFYKFTGKRPMYVANGADIILTEQKGFHWADIAVTKRLSRFFNINAGVRNLFGVDYLTSSVVTNGVHTNNGTASVGYGRSGYLGLVFQWEGN